MLADVVIGLQHGDEAKGKVTHHLCKSGEYTHVLRYNGGCNAGHTIYHEGRKFVTHHIPSGVFYGIKSIIGSGCVVNKEQFFKEINELEEGGVNTKGLIFIAQNTHVITDAHLEEDGKDTKIGTTKRGNGPAYRDKYNREGLLAKDDPDLKEYTVNLYDEFHENKEVKILCEGAQGFELDIDWGDYPFVTSSHCTTAGALLNAIPPSWIRNVWGVGKIYETYVGAKNFEPEQEVFSRIRELGEEYGATTGRPRQCNWLDVTRLIRAIKVNDVTHVVLNKMDILRQLDTWKIILGGEVVNLANEDTARLVITRALEVGVPHKVKVFFSDQKDKI
jgi:adenylosuccinate synthase